MSIFLNKINKKTIYLSVCVSALMYNAPSTAAETDLKIGLNAEASYDDNRFVSQTNKQDLYLFRVSPSLTATIEDERSLTSITTTGTFTKSSDETVEKDRFTYGINLNGAYELETANIGLGLGYDRESVFNSEFADTGIFANNTTRDRGFAQFNLQSDLNEVWAIRLSDNFQILDYSAGLYNNYWSNQAGLGLDWAFNERTAIITDFGYLRYEPTSSIFPTTNSYSSLIGIRHDISENTTMSITGGASFVNSEIQWSAVAQINHEIENYTFSLRAARELAPSAIGGLRQSEMIGASMNYAYSEGTSIGLEGSWRNSKTLNNIAIDKNRFLELSPWLSWEIIEDLNIRFSYRLRRQQLGLNNGWGISNSFYISLQY